MIPNSRWSLADYIIMTVATAIVILIWHYSLSCWHDWVHEAERIGS